MVRRSGLRLGRDCRGRRHEILAPRDSHPPCAQRVVHRPRCAPGGPQRRLGGGALAGRRSHRHFHAWRRRRRFAMPRAWPRRYTHDRRSCGDRSRRCHHSRRSRIPARFRVGRRRRRGHTGRRRRHRRSTRRPWRHKRERIDVTLRIRNHAHAEMDVRLLELGVRPTRADRSDDVALRDLLSASHRVRAEVDERHGVAIGRLDRDRLPGARNRPREGDCPRRGG